MSNIKNWSTTPLDNSDDPPHGAPEGWSPGDVNLVVRQQMADHRTQWQDAQWFNWGHAPVRQSNGSFLISGTATEIFTTGRRLRLYDATTIMAEVIASSAAGQNTLVSISGSSISSSLSSLDVAMINPSEAPLKYAAKTDLLLTSISAAFSQSLPVPANLAKNHPQLPRAAGVINSSDPLFGPFGTSWQGYNIASVTSTQSGAGYTGIHTITFAKSLTGTDYAVICSNAIVGAIPTGSAGNYIVKERAKGYVVIVNTDNTGVTVNGASYGMYFAIYGSSLED